MWLHDLDVMISTWAASLQGPGEGLFRLFVAGVCGGLVGLEREIRGRQAGFRTNILVCLGSALVMVVSTSFASADWQRFARPGLDIIVDPARIAYGVMTGIGFLGAGTIVQSRGSVRGLTTAAAMWCVAAMGLSAGFGLYLLTILSAICILAVLWGLDRLEDLIPKVRYRTVTVRVPWKVGCVAETVEYFKSRKMNVIDAGFERSKDLTQADVNLNIAFLSRKQYYSIERELEGDAGMQLMATREV